MLMFSSPLTDRAKSHYVCFMNDVRVDLTYVE